MYTPEAFREAGANANLIAAAPDLLEALEKVMEWHEKWLDEFPEETVRRALAKAKGLNEK